MVSLGRNDFEEMKTPPPCSSTATAISVRMEGIVRRLQIAWRPNRFREAGRIGNASRNRAADSRRREGKQGWGGRNWAWAAEIEWEKAGKGLKIRSSMKSWTLILAAGACAVAGSGCTQTDSTYHTKRGAVGGAVLGAAAGGIIGHQSGRGLEGAAIGAGAGALGGAVVGNARDEREDEWRSGQTAPPPAR